MAEPRPALDDPSRWVMYRYEPSLPAAAVFVAFFGITTILHIWQAGRKRSWFMTPFIIGGIFQFIGYIGRIFSSKDQWDRNPYIIQTLLLLLAPALYAATIYMILGRVILLTDSEKYSLIRRTWLTKIFVGGDILSFVIQGTGGGVMSTADKNPDNMKTGESITISGLFVQLFVFGFFVVVCAVFQFRGRAHLATVPREITWKKYMYLLYATSTLILIRSVFRIIEYLQGNAGYLLRHEVFLYIFDAMLMLAVMVIANIVHLGDIAIMMKNKKANTSSDGFPGLSDPETVERKDELVTTSNV